MKSQLVAIVAAVLLVGCAVNFFTIHNRPTTHQLHFAADRGNIEAAKQAIANGADVNSKAGLPKGTPLHKAAMFGHKEIVELLIAKGAGVNAIMSGLMFKGKTPLDLAFGETADLLRKHGGKSGAADDIRVAAVAGNIEAVKQHLAAGVDVNAKGWRGFTPLHAAANKEIAELLIAKSADVNAKIKSELLEGTTPLDMVSSDKHTETADLLVKHGGKSGAADSIHVAAAVGKIDAVKQHLAAGADVNGKDNEGYTSLHLAAGDGHKEIVELLIAKGADVNAKIEVGVYKGQTPLDIATHPDNPNDTAETADLLRKHGGKTKKELKAEGK